MRLFQVGLFACIRHFLDLKAGVPISKQAAKDFGEEANTAASLGTRIQSFTGLDERDLLSSHHRMVTQALLRALPLHALRPREDLGPGHKSEIAQLVQGEIGAKSEMEQIQEFVSAFKNSEDDRNVPDFER